MYQHILVAVALDHTHNPDESLAVAKALRAKGGKITALHVVEALPGHVQQYLPEDHQKRTLAHTEALLVKAVGNAATPKVTIGHAGRTLVDYAEAHNCDCIVIASHRPGLQDYFLGSTAARVVRHAQCAVHVLR